jgi:hypothetical protein
MPPNPANGSFAGGALARADVDAVIDQSEGGLQASPPPKLVGGPNARARQLLADDRTEIRKLQKVGHRS